jgi:hypothetical protein
MKAKILNYVFLVVLLFTVSQVQSQNLLTDGDFSATTEINNYGSLPPNEWCELKSEYVDADAKVIDGVCYYKVNSSGSQTWEVQLMQGGFILKDGHSYRLSFDVKSDAKTSFGVFLGENEGSWTSLLGYDNYTQFATTEWKTIVLDFKIKCGVFPYHKLSFELGTITTNMYFDNVVLEDLGAFTPSIGILGSSVNGWDVDVDMKTTDGINYTMSDYPLTSGYVKFRQDNEWCKNWGGADFPNGNAYMYGPDIQVPNPGNYDITFNRETGDYSFVCRNNCFPLIGIIGTAVPPYFDLGPDVNLTTSDGITYTLTNYTFTGGKAKFRQNDDWTTNWGSADFPAGIAAPDGDNILVPAGTYTVNFNVKTGAYNFEIPSIGILGTALNGWDVDIDMATTDGVIYTLTEYPFNDGFVKFRSGDSWVYNWGGWDFPTGWAWSNGPDIYVPAGIYTVTFNRNTGEYSFKIITCIQCPESIYTDKEPGKCGATVYYSDVVAALDCKGEGTVIEQIEGLPSGSFFPIGPTINTFLLTNAEGKKSTCSFKVFVFDLQPPVITGLKENWAPLWPANHRMVNIPLDYNIINDCGKIYTEIYVYSNEPENGTGDGDMSPDWKIVDDHNILLRAERSAKGTGREYYVYIVVRDENWNFDSRQIIIKVPHDSGNLSNSDIIYDNKTKSAVILVPEEITPFNARIWPNPSNGSFNLEIQSLSGELTVFSVFDITGKLISTGKTSPKEFIRFGENLRPGMYQVTLQQGDKHKNIKVLKQ